MKLWPKFSWVKEEDALAHPAKRPAYALAMTSQHTILLRKPPFMQHVILLMLMFPIHRLSFTIKSPMTMVHRKQAIKRQILSRALRGGHEQKRTSV